MSDGNDIEAVIPYSSVSPGLVPDVYKQGRETYVARQRDLDTDG
jgi:hypothetical protein